MALNVFMVHGHVMDGVTVQTMLMKLTVAEMILYVQTVTLIVMVMALNVFMVHGHVTVWLIVQTALMKLTVVALHVQTVKLTV